MLESDVKPADDLASVLWQQLSEHLDALVAAWASGEPPALAQFLPAAPPALRRLALTEAVKVDLEYRWQEPRRPRRSRNTSPIFPNWPKAAASPVTFSTKSFTSAGRPAKRSSWPTIAAVFPPAPPSWPG